MIEPDSAKATQLFPQFFREWKQGVMLVQHSNGGIIVLDPMFSMADVRLWYRRPLLDP